MIHQLLRRLLRRLRCMCHWCCYGWCRRVGGTGGGGRAGRRFPLETTDELQTINAFKPLVTSRSPRPKHPGSKVYRWCSLSVIVIVLLVFLLAAYHDVLTHGWYAAGWGHGDSAILSLPHPTFTDDMTKQWQVYRRVFMENQNETMAMVKEGMNDNTASDGRPNGGNAGVTEALEILLNHRGAMLDQLPSETRHLYRLDPASGPHLDTGNKGLPTRIFLAMNVFNCETVLQHLIPHVLFPLFLYWLGRRNIYISILESGSTDGTRKELALFHKALTKAHIPHRIVLGGPALRQGMKQQTSFHRKRIPYLARLRNMALAPLRNATLRRSIHRQDTIEGIPGIPVLTLPAPREEDMVLFDRVLFLNDIWVMLDDVLQLLVTDGGAYDAACALDHFWGFYDTFAMRQRVLPHGDPHRLGNVVIPGAYDPWVFLETGGGVQNVYSCWNGLISMQAHPFQNGQVQFRAWPWDEHDTGVTASECCLVHADLRRENYTRIVVNTGVRVAYNRHFYWLHRRGGVGHDCMAWVQWAWEGGWRWWESVGAMGGMKAFRLDGWDEEGKRSTGTVRWSNRHEDGVKKIKSYGVDPLDLPCLEPIK